METKSDYRHQKTKALISLCGCPADLDLHCLHMQNMFSIKWHGSFCFTIDFFLPLNELIA